jgi:hypothetical protein
VLVHAGPDEEQVLIAEIGGAGRRDARTRYTELWRPSLYEAPGAPQLDDN